MKTEFPNLRNFRDFSGYRCTDGAVLRSRVFARSDNPCSIEKSEIDELKNRDFTTIIDLRRENEREQRPDKLSENTDFDYHPIVMNDAPYYDLGEMLEPSEIAAAYYSKLTVSSDRIAEIFRILANAKTGVIFHCESGKDRTGTIAALLLLLCGVADDDIAEDYRLSYDRIYLDSPELLSDPTLVPMSETMNLFLERFHREYPVTDDYFISIGLTKKELEMIRNKIRE